MLRTGKEYLESLRDGRQVWIDGERVKDVTTHPAFKPIVEARARMYDMAHEAKHREVMSYRDDKGERFSRATRPPKTQQDWHEKRRWVETVMQDLGGIVFCVGDETIGEMWSLYDGRNVLDEIDPQFSRNIARA